MASAVDLPKNVKVAAWIYTIEAWPTTEAAGTRNFGTCSTNEKKIKVDIAWGRKKASFTLLHEILHAVYYEFGIEKDDSEERIVGSIADGLAAVFHDNPEVTIWITEGLAYGG